MQRRSFIAAATAAIAGLLTRKPAIAADLSTGAQSIGAQLRLAEANVITRINTGRLVLPGTGTYRASTGHEYHEFVVGYNPLGDRQDGPLCHQDQWSSFPTPQAVADRLVELFNAAFPGANVVEWRALPEIEQRGVELHEDPDRSGVMTGYRFHYRGYMRLYAGVLATKESVS